MAQEQGVLWGHIRPVGESSPFVPVRRVPGQLVAQQVQRTAQETACSLLILNIVGVRPAHLLELLNVSAFRVARAQLCM